MHSTQMHSTTATAAAAAMCATCGMAVQETVVK
jgi:hypothetical protein